jgi:hypothetical protein
MKNLVTKAGGGKADVNPLVFVLVYQLTDLQPSFLYETDGCEEQGFVVFRTAGG